MFLSLIYNPLYSYQTALSIANHTLVLFVDKPPRIDYNTNMKTWTPSEMGKKGGKSSVKKRLGGLSKEEVSEKMRQVRLAPKKEK